MTLMRWVVMMLALAALGACSNSNNLANPTSSSSTTVETSCNPATDGLCVSGQFVADQTITGVNYHCGNVEAVTDDGGFFSCPAESTITFSIQSFASGNKIVLGSTVVQPVLSGSVSTSAQTTVGSVVISLSDLVGIGPGPNGGALADPTNPSLQSQPAVEELLNIARFLNAINSNTVVNPNTGNPVPEWEDSSYSGFNGGNRIVIDDTVRAALAGLTASIDATAFTGSDLSPALKAFITSIPGRSLSDIPSVSVQQNMLQAFMIRENTGAYLASSTGCNLSGFQLIPDGMCNTSGGSQAPKSGNLLFFVDHAGYGYGFGMTTTASVVSSSPVPYPFYIPGETTDSNNQLQLTPPLRPISYFSGGFKLGALSYYSTDGQTPTTPLSPLAPVQWTGTVRQGAIAATADIYKTLYNIALPSGSSGVLGAWTYGDNTSQAWYVPNGQLTLFNIKPANSYLDANVFKTLKFPVNLHLTFTYNDGTCGSANPSCVNLDGLDISILKTGDIITNVNNDCNVIVDPSAPFPMSTTNVQQERIGYVSTVNAGSDSSGNTIYYASLTLLLPETPQINNYVPQDLQGVVAGVYSGNLVLLPMNGASALNITAADSVVWENFFQNAESASPPNNAGGFLLVQPQATSQCSS